MKNISIMCVDRIPYDKILHYVASIIILIDDRISLFNEDDGTFIGSESDPIKCVYTPLDQDFSFSLDVYLPENTSWNGSDLDFCRMFSSKAGSQCAVDTPDGNPFTWILVNGETSELISIDDNYKIKRIK